MVAVVEKPPRKVGEHGPAVSILTKVKARNLYLNERLPYAAIAEQTGLTTKTLQCLASREGWTAVRRQQEKRMIESSDARANSMRADVVEAIATASEQHAIRGLQKVGESLERSDEFAAKDFQSYTAGVKNLASLAKALREPGANIDGAQTLNLNLFFVPASVPAPQADAKQVTEIESKPVQ